MITLLQDEFLNTKFLVRLKKEIEKEQLQKTILEIDSLNKIQLNMLKKSKFQTKEKGLDLIKKISNARIKDL